MWISWKHTHFLPKDPAELLTFGVSGKKEEKMTRQSNIFQKWSLEGEMAALHHSVLQPSHFAGQQDDKLIFKGRNGGNEEEGGQHQQSAPHIPFCQLKTSEENNLQPMAAAGVSSNGDI